MRAASGGGRSSCSSATMGPSPLWYRPKIPSPSRKTSSADAVDVDVPRSARQQCAHQHTEHCGGNKSALPFLTGLRQRFIKGS